MVKRKANARTFGQDLMRGEHVVGGALKDNVKTNDGILMPSHTVGDPQFYIQKRAAEKKLGRTMTTDEFMTSGVYVPPDAATASGTSIFDPVLCELSYRWFCPPGGTILDPFSGGSVRGIVASKLGFKYVGVDLSARQVEANRAQGEAICDPENLPTWLNGNSLEIEILAAGVAADFVFSCPPYGDLEVYSDDPDDLSNMPYDKFIDMYSQIIAAAVRMLKPDRFACFVIGDIRDRDGFYRNFPAHTTQAFEDAGAHYYNEAILVTAVGSLPVRVTKQFNATRKLGRTHQNVYVYCKGDPRRATAAIGVDVDAQ